MATSLNYSSGQPAVALNPDGTGYAYYPNGTVAVAVSSASEYQNSFFAFDNNRKSTVVLGINELGIGFATSTSRKSAEVPKRIIVLSEIGAIVSDSGNILWEWRWDRRSMNAGVEPTGNIDTNLNEYLTFSLRDRSRMSLQFVCNGISHTFDLGAKVRRTDCYLDSAKREPGGKLIPQIPHVTLKQRQIEQGESTRAQRNKLHPRSENLSDMVKGIVSQLENRFEGLDAKMCTSPSLGTEWKTIALGTTKSEIPRIPKAGTETGAFSGFGDSIYVERQDFDLSKTLPSNLLDATGKWKDEANIRTALRETNPVLARSRILGANSGRYSDLLVVSKAHVNADNPTGMVRPLGVPLKDIKWSSLKSMIGASVGSVSAITAVLCVRGGDGKCFHAERVAEIVNIDVEAGLVGGKLTTAEGGAASGTFSMQENMKSILTKGIRLLRMDIGDNNDAITELGIKHLPTFIMYQGRNLVYCGVVGGQKLKMQTACQRPQVLLVEPNARFQISIEKVLKRYSCDAFLCLSLNEAVERLVQFANARDERARIIFDLVLISEELQGPELTVLMKNLSDFVNKKRTVVAGLVSVLGPTGANALKAVHWHEGITTDVNAVISKPLADCLTVATQKPLKPTALEKLLEMRIVPPDDENFGLTPESLVQLISRAQNAGQPGYAPVMNTSFEATAGISAGGSYVGIRLSAEDTKMRGRALVCKK